ncbi:helix-turn-helix domain-containing protein [Yinghuangia soli]|uniref:Helix-turn-helix domain-containing protein n=1 Tax=Yinghuangia soli TaxID=2908204 RepID=A0AA41U268_9ACTN|nr:helix-turn-helix domain-containing protein [Yinghuangia soli]MCF2531478.1 helix-turn-helix domain-containing protein [Yinghuangia soli]
MSLVLSTASVPPAHGLPFWNQALSRTWAPVTVTAQAEVPFAGSVRSYRLGGVRVLALEADAQEVTAAAAPSPDGCITVVIAAEGTMSLAQEGRRAVVRPGGMVLVDTSRPFRLAHDEALRLYAFHLPRRATGLPEATIARMVAVAVEPDSTVACVFGPFLASLARSASSFTPEVGERLADSIHGLLAALVADQGHSPPPEPDAARAQLALRIRDFVNSRLADRDLSPELIARAHRISVRHLHKVFEGEGITVRRLVQRRRLEECARELAMRGPSGPTVASVAQRWGFVSTAHFSRAFRSAYGLSPTQWRHTRTPTAATASP